MIDDVAKGSLNQAQSEKLQDMAQEEKLAHDLYTQLGASWDDTRFVRIAEAESRHLAQLRALLDRYGIDDPTEGLAEGRFSSGEFTTLYTQLLARGRTSASSAVQVAAEVERQDIKDLKAAADGVTAQDVRLVYDNLLKGSTRHLNAFTR